MNLQHKIYESLLGNEDDLVANNDAIIAESVKKYLTTSDSVANNLMLNDCYIDSHDGRVRLCVCQNSKTRYTRPMTSDRVFLQSIPKNDIIRRKSEFGKLYNGYANILGYIKDWPDYLSIAPLYSTTVSLDTPVNPLTIPEFSYMFFTTNMNNIRACTINCTLFRGKLDKKYALRTPININVFRLGNLTSHVYIEGEGLTDWSQFNKITSNTNFLDISKTRLAKNIIDEYDQLLSKEQDSYKFEETSFNKILNNFKNLNRIDLSINHRLCKLNNKWVINYIHA